MLKSPYRLLRNRGMAPNIFEAKERVQASFNCEMRVRCDALNTEKKHVTSSETGTSHFVTMLDGTDGI
jgi:hypothetical protein